MKNAQKAYIQKGMSTVIIQALNGILYANLLDSLFALKEIPLRETKSKTFNLNFQKKKKKGLHSTDVLSLETYFFSSLFYEIKALQL